MDGHDKEFKVPAAIYNLDDLRDLGAKAKMCPYFLARHFLTHSNIIVYSYSYIIDPKIANLVSAELQSDCVVVFDECHNIDNACIEAMSLNINSKSLEMASQALKRLEDLVKAEKQSGSQRLKAEYTRLVQGL